MQRRRLACFPTEYLSQANRGAWASKVKQTKTNALRPSSPPPTHSTPVKLLYPVLLIPPSNAKIEPSQPPAPVKPTRRARPRMQRRRAPRVRHVPQHCTQQSPNPESAPRPSRHGSNTRMWYSLVPLPPLSPAKGPPKPGMSMLLQKSPPAKRLSIAWGSNASLSGCPLTPFPAPPGPPSPVSSAPSSPIGPRLPARLRRNTSTPGTVPAPPAPPTAAPPAPLGTGEPSLEAAREPGRTPVFLLSIRARRNEAYRAGV